MISGLECDITEGETDIPLQCDIAEGKTDIPLQCDITEGKTNITLKSTDITLIQPILTCDDSGLTIVLIMRRQVVPFANRRLTYPKIDSITQIWFRFQRRVIGVTISRFIEVKIIQG